MTWWHAALTPARWSPGSVLINMRNAHLDGCDCRAVSASHDGGGSWLPPWWAPSLVEPVCSAGLLNTGLGGSAASDDLYFSNPATTSKRHNMTLRRSADGGASWSGGALLWAGARSRLPLMRRGVPASPSPRPAGPCAYSALAAVDEQTVGVVFEHGTASAYEAVSMAFVPKDDPGLAPRPAAPTGPPPPLRTAAPRWEVVSSAAAPVIGPAEARPHGVFQGFETGQYIKVDGTHYVVANELGLCEHVVWDKTTRAALWSAPSGAGPWTRVGTLRNTSSMYELCKLEAGRGLKNGCSWAPTLVHAHSAANRSATVWNLFFNGCEAGRFQPGDGIVHLVSTSDSLEGPYVEVGLSMPDSHAFSAWRLENGSYMALGNTPNLPHMA
jgi:hypothetical protein